MDSLTWYSTVSVFTYITQQLVSDLAIEQQRNASSDLSETKLLLKVGAKNKQTTLYANWAKFFLIWRQLFKSSAAPLEWNQPRHYATKIFSPIFAYYLGTFLKRRLISKYNKKAGDFKVLLGAISSPSLRLCKMPIDAISLRQWLIQG